MRIDWLFLAFKASKTVDSWLVNDYIATDFDVGLLFTMWCNCILFCRSRYPYCYYWLSALYKEELPTLILNDVFVGVWTIFDMSRVLSVLSTIYTMYCVNFCSSNSLTLNFSEPVSISLLVLILLFSLTLGYYCSNFKLIFALCT